MTVVGNLRAWLYRSDIQTQSTLYADVTARTEREQIQLDLLNREWQRIITEVSYYRELSSNNRLPRQFRTLAEFCDRVPVVSRHIVQQHGKKLAVDGARPDFIRMTGGSTSQPVHIPAWKSEVDQTRPDIWVGRSWYGVTPASKLFMLWGHSHLLGTGLAAKVRAKRISITDLLLGYKRYTAYNLSPEALRQAGEALLRHKPDYVLGYSVALDRFARSNADRSEAFHKLGLKVVIATAEAFPKADSPAVLSKVLGAPVAMEYGAVETAVVGHTNPEGGYRVFWRNYLLEAERVHREQWHVLRITSLYPRLFPLVRYEIGDEVDLGDHPARMAVGLDRFQRLMGRCNDYLQLTTGERIHSEAFSHVMRSCPELLGFQVVHRSGSIRIHYTAPAPLVLERVNQIRERLGKVHPTLATAQIVHVDRIPQTVAGKTRMIIEDPS